LNLLNNPNIPRLIIPKTKEDSGIGQNSSRGIST
jgi:hypothetical protein